jgi:hypothetical protein
VHFDQLQEEGRADPVREVRLMLKIFTSKLAVEGGLFVCLFVCLFVGWLAGWQVDGDLLQLRVDW